jgi:CheY-like chemotaxis protein
VMSTWRTAGRFDGHHVSVHAMPVWIEGDAARMEQVLANLVGNALKYTAAGDRVTVRVVPDDEAAVLEVSDSGVGIASALVDRVFESFVQGERGLDRSQGGLGLGLSVVKALVERHGGTVHASSPGPGKGAVFTARLPRASPVAQPRAPHARPAAPVTPRRILVIEDNEDAREMLRMALELAGHEVHAAPDGPSGVALAARMSPELVLVDVGLPGMDGYEVARRIRSVPGGKTMRLIAVTGYGQAQDRRRAEEAGFDLHLTKPVAAERLAEVIAAPRQPVRGTLPPPSPRLR